MNFLAKTVLLHISSSNARFIKELELSGQVKSLALSKNRMLSTKLVLTDEPLIGIPALIALLFKHL